jgi:hypothetical protein
MPGTIVLLALCTPKLDAQLQDALGSSTRTSYFNLTFTTGIPLMHFSALIEKRAIPKRQTFLKSYLLFRFLNALIFSFMLYLFIPFSQCSYLF